MAGEKRSFSPGRSIAEEGAPQPAPQSAGCALLHLSHLLDLAEGNEETAGVTVVPLFEGCPNEKQTNKSASKVSSIKGRFEDRIPESE
ncbi:hypothetical protein CapIbe_007603 [Capra ibex]